MRGEEPGTIGVATINNVVPDNEHFAEIAASGIGTQSTQPPPPPPPQIIRQGRTLR